MSAKDWYQTNREHIARLEAELAKMVEWQSVASKFLTADQKIEIAERLAGRRMEKV